MKVPQLAHLTTDDKIIGGPILVQSLTLASDGAAGSVLVYDGTDTGGRLKASLHCASDGSFQMLFPVPVLFDMGIFANLENTTDHLMVAYYSANRQNTTEWPIIVESNDTKG